MDRAIIITTNYKNNNGYYYSAIDYEYVRKDQFKRDL